jgi:hypothetical protein
MNCYDTFDSDPVQDCDEKLPGLFQSWYRPGCQQSICNLYVAAHPVPNLGLSCPFAGQREDNRNRKIMSGLADLREGARENSEQSDEAGRQKLMPGMGRGYRCRNSHDREIA